MRIPIKINTIEDIKFLYRVAQEENCGMKVCCENTEINADSVLGLSSLMGKSNLYLLCPDSFEKNCIKTVLR